jgi:hypothetical protein
MIFPQDVASAGAAMGILTAIKGSLLQNDKGSSKKEEHTNLNQVDQAIYLIVN